MDLVLKAFFVPLVIYIGVVTTVSDFKENKIKNKTIVLGLIYFIIIFTGFTIWNIFAEPLSYYYWNKIMDVHDLELMPVMSLGVRYYASVFINSIITLFIVYVLWMLNVFAAGDAKLFFLYSLIIPLNYYWKSYLPFFPSINIFLNTFLIILLYLFIVSVCYYLKNNYMVLDKSVMGGAVEFRKYFTKNGKKVVKDLLRTFFWYLSIFFSFTIVSKRLAGVLNISEGEIISILFLLLILLMPLAKKVFKKKIYLRFAILYFFGLYLYGYINDSGITLTRIYSSLKLMVVFMILRKIISLFIDSYIKKKSHYEISSDKLKKGYILEKELIGKIKDDNEYCEKNDIYFYTGGVSEENVGAVRKWLKIKKIDKIKIFKPFVLAFWIFLGVITTMLCDGSIISMFLN